MILVHKPQVIEALNLLLGENLTMESPDWKLNAIDGIFASQKIPITVKSLDIAFANDLKRGVPLDEQMKVLRQIKH